MIMKTSSVSAATLVLAALSASAAFAPLCAKAAAVQRYVDVAGARIVSQAQVTARTVALTIATPSFATNTVVEVTLPVGYAADTGRRWPVTYYLAGTNQSEASFRALYKGEQLTLTYPSIVVSPNGAAGYWSDWYNAGAGGPPTYATFVSAQLIPLIDANFRTIAERSQRAIMGESMGGFGVMMLAARHPDLFVAASSLSGGVDTNYAPGTLLASLSPAIMLAMPDAIFGPRLLQEIRWRGHNPADLASNLRDVRLQVRTGNGSFSSADGETIADLAGCVVEASLILPESISFHNALTAAGVEHDWKQYLWGCHSVALFGAEIADTLAGLTAAFGTPPPSTFDYRSIAPAFSVYGWSVVADPTRALEFIELRGVSKLGLSMSGSGITSVSTPPLFAAGRAVSVAVNGALTSVMATPDGRINFTVDLGPANSEQQFRIGTVTTVASASISFAQQ